MKNKMTQWQHFKKNYLWTFIAINLIGLTTLIMSLVRVDGEWCYSLFFFAIAWIAIPIGNYLSWRKK